ncbi:MAG: succinate dehydrogenase, cytochrome b556 subunit [Pseudomonadota bacterium]|nr:succinate dehydrogenase, cytochrome b556 subunit [Pseudomonadota bacterium]
MNRQRPFFLDLLAIRLPIGGVVSILHRASGAFLALAIPALLYALMLSLRSPQDFARVQAFFGGGLGWLIGLVALWALLHHLFAGLRHLGFDIGYGEEKIRARLTAKLAMAAAIVLVGGFALIGLAKSGGLA